MADTLPFEVPPTFSNSGFFQFLTRFDVRLFTKGNQRWIRWEASDDSIDLVIEILFGRAPTTKTKPDSFGEFVRGKIRQYRKIEVSRGWTHPYHFDISHKEKDFRRLTVVHPRHQLAIADFYHTRVPEILYHSSLSEFSIRRPAAVATSAFFDDTMHQILLGPSSDFIQEFQKEYENLGSYFTYERYSNIFKFYESYQYHNAEKKFDNLLKLDISKCFDSIYTHAIEWSVLGHSSAKDNLKPRATTFGATFDALMQHMNRGETNGIVIGPEFSRIFAEIQLQRIDVELSKQLEQDHELYHKRDYRVFRYVDDYFIFYNQDEDVELIRSHLARQLRTIKLNLNAAKSLYYKKPIITEQTIAKNRVSSLMNEHLGVQEKDAEIVGKAADGEPRHTAFVNSQNLIVGLKTVLSELKLPYSDILNYTLSIVERSLQDIVDKCCKGGTSASEEKSLARVFVGILEFCFFAYSAAPRVNFSIRLVRILASMVDAMEKLKIKHDTKQHVFKYAHDNLVRQIRTSGGNRFSYIETMYLFLGLAKLGRKYVVPEKMLLDYFGIKVQGKNSLAEWPIDMFTITVCLSYIRNRKAYSNLRRELENQIISIFESKSAYLSVDTEVTILFFDVQSCPYISQTTKRKIAKLLLEAHSEHGLAPTPAKVTKLLKQAQAATPYWFTKWSSFDLSDALDRKKAREVY